MTLCISPFRNFAVSKLKEMDTKKDIRDNILYRAERLQYYNKLLIEQCTDWLSEEEGNRNMEKRILERKRKLRRS